MCRGVQMRHERLHSSLKSASYPRPRAIASGSGGRRRRRESSALETSTSPAPDASKSVGYDASVGSELDRTAGTLRRRLLAIAGVLMCVLLLGTLGFTFIEGWPVFDAFYMALMTLTTVGYGEVHPLSFHGRVFASALMLVGVATVFVAFAILGETLLRLELADYFGRRVDPRLAERFILRG